ncbi:pyridoxal phosphate-dependent aminotransferase [Uliginosibacterium sp. H1]|uniref:pyridoxal phosphate-dependent aminotransferase n=1 Tax=Uliginosibacterium sp. H1 TaxID=3114757 RepID=UPI002E185495|nr:pyridoxal phosphate-dependent aminotransferase [Uliginosibacterium sp. H1]
MPHFPAAIESRLPDVGTTIFTVMSRLAAEHGAINLSQGFPDFSPPASLVERVAHHMRAGANQYPPMAGVLPLREALAAKMAALYGTAYDPEHEITVTAGGTQALYTAVACMVRPGDEVIVFQPVYDSYIPAIELNGGKTVVATLQYPDYRPDWAAVRALVTPRTRLIMLNTPHNPSGSVWTADDMAQLADVVRGTRIAIVSDEVYEHMVYDGARHESCARHPELASRSFVCSSFGKTVHATGWKVGHVAAPRELMAEFRKAHQFTVFTVNTPMQLALADWMQDASGYLELADFYQRKRDFFRDALASSRLQLLPCRGTYFQLASYAAISDEDDATLARRWTQEIGVASIPVSAFYTDPVQGQHKVLRFCFAKNEDTLARACDKLVGL